MSELTEYCEGKPSIVSWENGYLLVTDKEIVDLASTKAVPLKKILELLRFCKGHFNNRVVSLDARASTSYPLLLIMARRKRLEILTSAEWEWDGELFYELTVRFI